MLIPLPGYYDMSAVRNINYLNTARKYSYIPEYKYSKGINLGYMTKNKFLVSKYLTKSIPQNTVRCEDTGEVFMIK